MAYPIQSTSWFMDNIDSTENYQKLKFILKEAGNVKTFFYLIQNNRLFVNPSISHCDTCILRLHFDVEHINVILLPKIHLAYFYPSIYRTKAKWYFNFSIDHYIKNWGDDNWKTDDYLVNIKIYDSKLNLVREGSFGGHPSKYSKHEGWIGTTFADIDYIPSFTVTVKPKLRIFQWQPYAPNVYTYTIEVLNDSLVTYETFVEKVGFRYIEEIDQTIHINNKKVVFKSTRINTRNPLLEREYLYDLKRNNFNTIILESKGNEELFDLCDSLGLFVVQEISKATFASLSDLLNYFMMAKDHPSFVMWKDNGFEQSSVRILQRLDYSRSFYNSNYDIQFRTINNWDSLDISEKMRIKNQFQNFDFWFSPKTLILDIQLLEPFRYIDKIALRWSIKKFDAVVEQGLMDKLELTTKRKVHLTIPFDQLYSSNENYKYEFEIVIKDDIGVYRKGDIIALSKFQWFLNGPEPILNRVY